MESRTLVPSAEALAELRRLQDASLHLQAHAVAAGYAPLERWTGPEALLRAGVLAAHLGAEHRARRLFARALCRAPHSAEARLWLAITGLSRRGPLATWQWLKVTRLGDDTPDDDRANLLLFRSRLAATLRDFDTAASLHAQAESLAPGSPALGVARTFSLARQDRYDEALESARAGLEAHPLHRSTLLWVAHLLQLGGRREEALEVLHPATRSLESADLVRAVVAVLLDLRRFAEAGIQVDRYEALVPLAEPEVRRQIAALRSEIAHYGGDYARAAAQARAAGTPFHDRIAERLEQPAHDDRAVLLDLPFIRQHHMTCAPATLAMLARYWGRPAEHLEIAQSICYDGTSSYAARRWAEQGGWVARELTVSWQAATELLERGAPFLLGTVQAASAHAQAVIGFDGRRRTLHVRDPYLASVQEVDLDALRPARTSMRRSLWGGRTRRSTSSCGGGAGIWGRRAARRPPCSRRWPRWTGRPRPSSTSSLRWPLGPRTAPSLPSPP